MCFSTVLPAVQASKGPSCGTSTANQTAVADLASEGLRLRSELQRAIDEERYADAAKVRDRLKDIQDSTAEATSQGQDNSAQGPERKYQLGQRVKHAHLGYDGVICGCISIFGCLCFQSKALPYELSHSVHKRIAVIDKGCRGQTEAV